MSVDLRDRYDFANGRFRFFEYVLLLGIALEMSALFVNTTQKPGFIFALTAQFLVLAGVWGEIHFGHEARLAGDGILAEAEARIEEAKAEAVAATERASLADQRAAEANERAAVSEQKTAQLQRDAMPRNFGTDGPSRALLAPYAGTTVVIVTVSEFEAKRFGAFIAASLQVSKWPVIFRPRDIVVKEELVIQDGVSIFCWPFHENPEGTNWQRAAQALIDCFRMYDIEPIQRPVSNLDIGSWYTAPFKTDLSQCPPDTIFLVIGIKPPHIPSFMEISAARFNAELRKAGMANDPPAS